VGPSLLRPLLPPSLRPPPVLFPAVAPALAGPCCALLLLLLLALAAVPARPAYRPPLPDPGGEGRIGCETARRTRDLK